MKNLARQFVGVTAFGVLSSAATDIGAAAPGGRYTISNGTVYDSKTKLTWQQTTPGTTYNVTDARAYCSGLSLNGTGWRLPTLKELVTVVDFSVPSPGPTIDSIAFPVTPSDSFFSSTPEAADFTFGWVVNFSNGGVSGVDLIAYKYYVRCVR